MSIDFAKSRPVQTLSLSGTIKRKNSKRPGLGAPRRRLRALPEYNVRRRIDQERRLPTVIEPPRREWKSVRAVAITHVLTEGNAFHDPLRQVKLFEVAAQFGASFRLELAIRAVDLHKALGLGIKPRAAAIAELVLWIGYFSISQ